MTSKLPTTWSYPEFHAFVMLYAANADSHITDDEIALIRPTLLADQYQAVFEAFSQCSDMEALEHILTYRDRYFPSEAGRNQLLSDMETIFKADSNYSVIEKGFQRIFGRLI
jgi:hypothetical protein